MDNLESKITNSKNSIRKYEKYPENDLESHLRHTYDPEVILEYIEDCMKMEINRKFRGPNGNTPLSWVVLNGLKEYKGKYQIMKALIDRGADPYAYAPDHEGNPMRIIDQIKYYFAEPYNKEDREKMLDICLRREKKKEENDKLLLIFKDNTMDNIEFQNNNTIKKSEVIDKNQQTADALQRFLTKTYPEINDLLLVNLDHLDKKGVEVMQKHKLNPIILYGFQNITDPNLESKLVSIFPMLKNGNVGFMRMPAILKEEILDQYLKLKEKNNELDRLVFDLEGKAKQQVANRLLHDLQPGKPYSIKNNALQEAKDILGLDNISEEEIIQELEQIKLEVQKQIDISKEVIKGVFCDTAGTLLVGEKEDELNIQTVELLKLLELQGHEITIWTGGDEKQYAKVLKEKGITWPVVSKYDFENKRVEIAIDDLPQKKYEKDYKIFAEKFIQIQ